MGLSLTILGCTGSYPGPGDVCSGYLLQSDGTNVMVDAGPGTVAALQDHLALEDLDAVVLSHSHPDHWTDLMVLRTAWKYGLRREGLVVLGTEDTREHAAAIAESHLSPTFDWRVIWDGATTTVGDLALCFSSTDHYVETLALRADVDGRSFAYSADTGPGWSFAELGDGIHLGLCEATFATDEEQAGVLHLSAGQAGAMARVAGVERLVLTHLLPGADAEAYRTNAVEAFGRDVDVATRGARFDV